jgi:hypothetical protein
MKNWSFFKTIIARRRKLQKYLTTGSWKTDDL